MSQSAKKTKRLAVVKKPSEPKSNPALVLEEGDLPEPVKPGQAQRTARAFPWLIGFVVILLSLAVGYIVGVAWPWSRSATSTAQANLLSTPDAALPLKPGPWGNMEYLPVNIEPPEEYLSTSMIEHADRRWRFEGFTPAQLTALFQNADLTDAQRVELLDASKWDMETGAIYVVPSKDLVLSLSPRARKQIYAPLTSDPSNIYGLLRCSYPAASFDTFFDDSGLPPETIALVKKLSYPYGHLVFFCDMPLVLDTLQTPDQKMRLMKALLRKSTLLLRLYITPDSNLADLEHYWIKAGWGVDLRPMMESLAKLPGGARIDVIELLPPLPSANLYNYSFPSLKPEDRNKDCRWTAMNFFRDTPDDRFTDSNVVRQTLATDYYPVESDPRFGDIVALAKPNGDIIHLAVFIADNIVYTKNSANFRDPFILMTMPDIIDHFSAQIPEDQSLQVQYYRNKYY